MEINVTVPGCHAPTFTNSILIVLVGLIVLDTECSPHIIISQKKCIINVILPVTISHKVFVAIQKSLCYQIVWVYTAHDSIRRETPSK